MVVRKYRRLVPKGGVECFEIRVTLFFDKEGDARIAYQLCDPDGPVAPPLHEVLGALEFAKSLIVETYNKKEDDD